MREAGFIFTGILVFLRFLEGIVSIFGRHVSIFFDMLVVVKGDFDGAVLLVTWR